MGQLGETESYSPLSYGCYVCHSIVQELFYLSIRIDLYLVIMSFTLVGRVDYFAVLTTLLSAHTHKARVSELHMLILL